MNWNESIAKVTQAAWPLRYTDTVVRQGLLALNADLERLLRLMGGAKTSGERLRKNASTTWVPGSLICRNFY